MQAAPAGNALARLLYPLRDLTASIKNAFINGTAMVVRDAKFPSFARALK